MRAKKKAAEKITVNTVTNLHRHLAGDGDQGRTLFIKNDESKQRVEIWHDIESEHTLPDGWDHADGFRMAIGDDDTQHPNQDYTEVSVDQVYTEGAED